MVSSTGMTLTAGIEIGIGDGARAVTATGWGAAPRRRDVRCATGSLQRVTRSAKASTCWAGAESSRSARRTPAGRRREPVELGSDLGGPAPLTEDRQKPRCRLDGMHGTRNTVPSRASGTGKPCLPARSLLWFHELVI
jgi:hypothetical protein